jgi:hypothetical protein
MSQILAIAFPSVLRDRERAAIIYDFQMKGDIFPITWLRATQEGYRWCDGDSGGDRKRRDVNG